MKTRVIIAIISALLVSTGVNVLAQVPIAQPGASCEPVSSEQPYERHSGLIVNTSDNPETFPCPLRKKGGALYEWFHYIELHYSIFGSGTIRCTPLVKDIRSSQAWWGGGEYRDGNGYVDVE